ncbi:hypothetical protein Tco_0498997 [Tanacetum coccineum]
MVMSMSPAISFDPLTQADNEAARFQEQHANPERHRIGGSGALETPFVNISFIDANMVGLQIDQISPIIDLT